MPSGRDRKNYAAKRVNGKNTEVTDRYQALLDGTIKIEDLETDELIQGKLFNKNGDFRGRPPLMIPRTMHNAIVRELVHRTESGLFADYDHMYEVLVGVATNERVNAQARVQAAIYVIERISGKIPDKTEMSLEVRKFEQMVEEGKLMIDLGELPALTSQAHEVVVDAEVVEEKPTPPPRVKRRRSPRAQ